MHNVLGVADRGVGYPSSRILLAFQLRILMLWAVMVKASVKTCLTPRGQVSG